MPGSQVWPGEHWGLGPHLHCPPTHALAPPTVQAVHPAPLAPHAPSAVPGMQRFPWQQPVEQLVVLHTQLPPTHCWPALQAGLPPQRQVPPEQLSATAELQGAHAAPFCPHWVALWPVVMHSPPALQQPLGQLVASQRQAVPEHRCPG